MFDDCDIFENTCDVMEQDDAVTLNTETQSEKTESTDDENTYLSYSDISGAYITGSESGTAFVSIPELMEITGCSKSAAYRLVNKLNAKMKLTYPDALYIKGKVNREYFEEAFFPVQKRRMNEQAKKEVEQK